MTLPSRAAAASQQRRGKRMAAAYRRPLEAGGARVVELSPDAGQPTLDGLHALLLTGGGDLHPRRYRRRPHPKLTGVDCARDEFELRLAAAALAASMPVLGICRGAQVLGVALRGDLIQDIDSSVKAAIKHSSPPGQAVSRHWVALAAGSRLRRIVGAERMRVNSYHHQANGRLGPGARAAAWSEDGVIEAIEHNGGPFVIGVQWHPERVWRRSPRQRRLFAAFVVAAGDYARTTSANTG
jgi:putative glutamine amidotransferase